MCVGLAGEVEGRERGRGCVVWATGTWGVGSTLWRSLAFLVFSCLFLVFSFVDEKVSSDYRLSPTQV